MTRLAYLRYKDSGIEWLGEIPAHWNVKRNALLFDQRDERGYPELPILNVSIANGVQLREFSEEHIEQKASDHGVYKRAVAGDIAFNKMRMWQGSVGVAPEDGLVSPDYTVAVPRSGVSSRFFSYLFRIPLHMSKVYCESHGIVDDRNRLYWEGFRDIQEPVPSPQEQLAIADFLDRETAKIDALVERKERLIELLQEKRTALITHAVTKGLDPNVPMKDSGIEWLGRIPAHWSAGRAKTVARLESGHTPSRQHPEYWEGCTVPWFGLADVWQIRGDKVEYVQETNEKVSELGLANSSARKLPKGTVILSRTASVGFSAIMGEEMATTQDFANWVPSPSILSEFLLYVMRAMRKELGRLVMGSTHKTIYMPDIASLTTPIPPRDEQDVIVAHIRKETEKIDALIGKIGEAIERLKEYRTALISAAVTGKIDVREELR